MLLLLLTLVSNRFGARLRSVRKWIPGLRAWSALLLMILSWLSVLSSFGSLGTNEV